jgi:hypothetical protein
VTERAKPWIDVGVPPLDAVNVTWNTPLAVAVPESDVEPFPLSVKVTPGGSALVSVIDGVGVPSVVTVKELAAPSVKVSFAWLVMDYGADGAPVSISVEPDCV